MISIVITTYGKPIFLQKSIQSIINQSFKNWELIIVDDNDPDTESRSLTESLVGRYLSNDTRINYIQHEHNKNGAVARNSGYAIAKGKYISFLDSDDEYMPDRLQKCYDAMENASADVKGVFTGCEFRKSGKTYFKYTDIKGGNYLIETLACKFMFCTGSNIFVRKSVVDELDGFDGAFPRHQDYEFLVRVFEKYSLIAIPEVLVIKNNDNFNLPNLDKQIAIKKQYLTKFKYIIDTLPKKDVNFIMHGNFIELAEMAMVQNKFKVANTFYYKASQYGRLSFKEWSRRLVFPLYNFLNANERS